jgi:hypothetical protein
VYKPIFNVPPAAGDTAAEEGKLHKCGCNHVAYRAFAICTGNMDRAEFPAWKTKLFVNLKHIIQARLICHASNCLKTREFCKYFFYLFLVFGLCHFLFKLNYIIKLFGIRKAHHLRHGFKVRKKNYFE